MVNVWTTLWNTTRRMMAADLLKNSFSRRIIKCRQKYSLHHMSRIFEDNSKIDQIHRGLQIDRKRRQELQRKRLAMGHKPDDHEEQTFR